MTTLRTYRSLVFMLFSFCLSSSTFAAVHADEQAPELKNVKIEEHLGAQVPLDAKFVNDEGKAVSTHDVLSSDRPTILTLNYYSCPMLCTMVLNGMVDGLNRVGFTPGIDYQIATISIDPTETSQLAKDKKSSYLASFHRSFDNHAWQFLVGDETNINRVADAVGFSYHYDPDSKQYAHAAGIFVLMPGGRISRVLYGIDYRPQDLKLALLEASQGKIGSSLDKLLLYCFHYDPSGHRYSLYAINVMRLGAALTVLILGAWIALTARRATKKVALATKQQQGAKV